MKYRFIKDFKLAGKKVGDEINFDKVPRHLQTYLEPTEEQEVGKNDGDEDDGIPTKEWTVAEIVSWLGDNGVTNAKGTKDELLKEVKKVLKK